MYIDMYMHLPECSGATFYSALFGKLICTVAISVPFSLGGRAFSPFEGKQPVLTCFSALLPHA